MSDGKRMTIGDQFRLRIKSQWLQDATNVSNLAINAFNEIQSMRVKNANQPSANYRSDMRVHVAAKTGPVIGKATRALNRLRTRLENESARAREKALTPSTPRAVQIAEQIRAGLKNMDATQRSALLFGDDADQATVLAVLEPGLPAWLSGLHDEERGRLEKQYMAKHHPDMLQTMADNADAIAHANESLNLATAAASNECAFPDGHEFKKYFEVASAPEPGELEGAARTAAQAERDAARQAVIDKQNEKLQADYVTMISKAAA
jgi:hypothetical protein